MINSRKLLGLLVATESGTKLGAVISFDLDSESHGVSRYCVGPHRWSRKENLLIAPAQVLGITAERLIVSDSVVAEKETGRERLAASPAAGRTSPAAISPLITRQN